MTSMDEIIDTVNWLYEKEVSVYHSFYITCTALLAFQFIVDLIASYASNVSKYNFWLIFVQRYCDWNCSENVIFYHSDIYFRLPWKWTYLFLNSSDANNLAQQRTEGVFCGSKSFGNFYLYFARSVTNVQSFWQGILEK